MRASFLCRNKPMHCYVDYDSFKMPKDHKQVMNKE